MGSPSPDRLAEITEGIAATSGNIVRSPNPTSPRIRTNRKGFLQLGGALVASLTGLGMAGGVSAQEVPPPTDPDKPNPPFEMGEDEARVLALDTSKETVASPDTSAGGETVENPLLPKRSYEGKLGILKTTNSINTVSGELDVKRSVTVTSQEALDQVEALFAKKGKDPKGGLTGYAIDFNTFDYDEAYRIFRTQKDSGIQPSGLRICPTNNDPRCKINFINIVISEPKPGERKLSEVFDILDPNAPLSQIDIDYLNRVLNQSIAINAGQAIYGSIDTLMTNPDAYKEFNQLANDVGAIAAFRFNFTPTTTTP